MTEIWLFVSALLLCTPDAHEIAPLELPSLEVVASSPLPAGHRAGSGYGYRISGRTGRRTFHAGLDFAAERGTPVYAVAEGVVESVAVNDRRARSFRGYGNAVVIRHESLRRWSFYAHLDESLVEAGQRVHPGQPIGRVGRTNNRRFRGMAAHLHFEVRRAQPGGVSPFPGVYRHHNVNPMRFLRSLGVQFGETEENHCSLHGELDVVNAPVLTMGRPSASQELASAPAPRF